MDRNCVMNWEIAPQSLKFTLSDIQLGQFHFRALVSETPITSLLELLDPPLPESFPSGLASAVIRNFPASEPLPVFRWQKPWLRYIPVCYPRFLVKRDGTFENYLAKFSSKSRKNLRRSVKNFEEAAGADGCWREYSTEADVSEFHRLAADLSQKTYQTKLLHEGFEFNEETRKRLDALAAKASLRGYLLFFQGRAVAFALCEVKDDVLLYKTVGYDPEFRDFSPGTVLLWRILERFFAEGRFSYLDFGEGGDVYKEFFSNFSLQCVRVYFFRLKPLVVAALLLHRSWNLLLDVGTQLPAIPRLVKRLKRALRQQGGRKAAGAEVKSPAGQLEG